MTMPATALDKLRRFREQRAAQDRVCDGPTSAESSDGAEGVAPAIIEQSPANATPCEISDSAPLAPRAFDGEFSINLIHDDHDRAVVEHLRGLRLGCPPRPTTKAQSHPPCDSAARDGDRVGGTALIAPKASIPFPAGWSVTAWRDRLLQLADACAPLHPARAGELRHAANDLNAK